MEKFISDLGQNYKLDNFRIKNDTVVFEVSSVLKDVVCTYCGHTSSIVSTIQQKNSAIIQGQDKGI